jgi:glycosyltransferase involved in cell wall biosynthesis/polysaccharide pyruvyl transferase WcaK-like protein
VRKVSIVVPTYNSPEQGLTALVDSLDAQTMARREFEIIFVDDGSTDGTYDTLRVIADARDNVRLERIENSGWPSTPRNLGLDLATGEYVLFMDHDDQLYPHALQAAYDFARRNGADVLNGKEAYTNRAFWALSTYTADMGQSLGREDGHPLLPLNPHKLYRREFLAEHDIRFIEGRKVLWEDQFFNLKVARHAQVISTMSSVPFYHWVYTKGSGSTLFVKNTEDYWMWLRRLLQATVDELSEDHLVGQREQLLLHQYGARVLGALDARFADRPSDERAFLFDHIRSLRNEFDLARFDDRLDWSRRMRAQVLTAGDVESMTRLCADDLERAARASAESLVWRDGVLHVAARVDWPDASGAPLQLERDGDRLLAPVSPVLRDLLPPPVRDMSADIQRAMVDCSVRSRVDRVVWLTPSETSVTVGDDALPALQATVTGTIDPATAAMGASLDSTYWDVFVRTELGSWVTHLGLESNIAASVSLAGEHLHLVYPNDGGAATIIPDGRVEAVRRLAPVGARRVAPGRYEIDLAGTHDGTGQVATRVGVAEHSGGKPVYSEVPATIRIEDGRAVLRVALTGAAVVRVGDRAPGGASGWVLAPHGEGEVRFEPVGARTGAAPRRILLLTNRDSDNVGDQIIEATVISLIKGAMADLGFAADEFAITSRAAGIISKRYMRTGDPALLEDARKAISAADVIVFGGAPLFNYSYQLFYLRTIKTLELAQEYGVPVLFSSIGVEAFDATNPRSVALRDALALPCVRQITTRDDIESLRNYVEGTSIPIAHVADPAVFADVVFGAAEAKKKSRGGARPRIGLVVTRAGIFKDNGIHFPERAQRAFWRDVIAMLDARGYDYKLMTTGHFSDEVFLDSFIKADGIPLSKAAVAINSPEELSAELSACDGIIAYRLHASITAFSYGIPSIGLSWNFKVPYFYESVGLGHRALPHQRWNADDVVSALERAIEEGVPKDEAFLASVYDTLFAGLRGVFDPDSTRAPSSYTELRRTLPRYAGTTPAQYRDKVRNKLRRTYENYQKHYAAATEPDSSRRTSLARRAARKVKSLLRGGR